MTGPACPGWQVEAEGDGLERARGGQAYEKGPRELSLPGPFRLFDRCYSDFLMSKQMRQVGMFSGSADPSSMGS